MHGKSRVSSAIKYDCFKLGIGCTVFDLKRNLGQMTSFRIAREASIAVLVCSILMNTILMNIL